MQKTKQPQKRNEKWTRRLFHFIFKKTILKIIKEHQDTINLVQVIELNAAATRVYIEVLEMILADIYKYFKPYSGISARQTMRNMRDFCSDKLDTLKKLDNEYKKLEERYDVKAERTDKDS